MEVVVTTGAIRAPVSLSPLTNRYTHVKPRYTCERFQKRMKSKNHALSITWINRVLCICSNYRLLKKFSVLETLSLCYVTILLEH